MRVVFLALACPLFALAGPRSSPNYTIPADVLDSGGKATSSVNYQHIASAGVLAGISGTASGIQFQSGYVAQVAPAAVEALGAISRKTHGVVGAMDINLPLTGVPGIECRSSGAGGSHQVIVTFASAVSASGVSVMSRDGQAGATVTVNNSVVTVNLTAVANAQTLGITLLQVNNGSNVADVSVPMSVLLGDTNGSGSVSASDIGLTKAASGQPVGVANFRADVNVSGSINASDIGLAKSASGSSLP